MSQSLSLAQEVAWNLATTLMVCVTLFKTDLGFGVYLNSQAVSPHLAETALRRCPEV
jgi:hypothetical protein